MRALVIEDEAAILMLIVDFLNERGIEVAATASRVPEAVKIASTFDVDVAILDVNLMGQLSYPVATILQSRGIPFVFATGYGRAGIPTSLEKMVLLAKPFTLEQLYGALGSVVDLGTAYAAEE
jgi:CheY-like chemotaxis protein